MNERKSTLGEAHDDIHRMASDQMKKDCPLCAAGIPATILYQVEMADRSILQTKNRKLAHALLAVPKRERIVTLSPPPPL